jgi:hypothetical protein
MLERLGHSSANSTFLTFLQDLPSQQAVTSDSGDGCNGFSLDVKQTQNARKPQAPVYLGL